MIYFAYGSNMSHNEIRQKCPHGKFLKRAYVKNHKLVFDGHSKKRDGAVANIIESEGNVVWGGLFEIIEDDLKALNHYEGYLYSYDRKTVTVNDDQGNSCEAIVYYREGATLGAPSESYRALVIEGAKDCNLPGDYIESLKM